MMDPYSIGVALCCWVVDVLPCVSYRECWMTVEGRQPDLDPPDMTHPVNR